MSLTLEISGDALTLQIGDNEPLELELSAAALTLELGAIVAFSDNLGSRVVLSEDTTLEIANGSGNTYVNDDVELVVELPTSSEIGARLYRARFVLAYAKTMTIAAQGSDAIRWSGIDGASLESADRDAVLDVEYIGDGVFTVTGAQREWGYP